METMSSPAPGAELRLHLRELAEVVGLDRDTVDWLNAPVSFGSE